MLSDESSQQIEKMAEQVAAEVGCRVYDIEFSGGATGRVLRVYIESQSKPGGADVDDCANVSRGLNLLLDENENIIPGGAYNLEVSTPGIERNLKKDWHFAGVVGKKISLRLLKSVKDLGLETEKFATYKQLTGKLISSTSSQIQIEAEGEELSLPIAEIEKAKVVFEFGRTEGSKAENKKKKH